MDRTLLVNGLTFLLVDLIIFWKLTDPRSKAEKLTDFKSLKVWAVGLFAFFFLILNYLSGIYFPLPASGFDDLIDLLGILTFFTGFVISIWSKLTIGKQWGAPVLHNQKRQTKLIKHGPFGYSRNPIYVGLILVLAGYGLALQSVFTFLVIFPAYYFYNSALKEEINLEKLFKEEYKKYKSEVPRFF